MIKKSLSIIVLSVLVIFINCSNILAQEKDWVWARHGADQLCIDNNDNLIYYNGLTITKKDVNENQLWSITGTGNGSIVAIDNDILGNIYVLGNFTSSVAFGSESITSPYSYSSGFLFKFTSGGVFISKKVIGGNSIIKLNGLDIDANQNVAIIGDYAGVNVDFGNGFTLENHYRCKDGTTNCLFSEYELRFPFLVKIGADNNTKWTCELIMGLIWRWDIARFTKVVFDSNGEIFLAANYEGYNFHWNSSHDQFTWGDYYSSINQPTCLSPHESFLIKLNANGYKVWTKQIAQSDILDIISNGTNFIITGETGNKILFKDGTQIPLSSDGLYILNLGGTGIVQNTYAVGANSYNLYGNYPIKLDGSGNIYIAGCSHGNIAGFQTTNFIDQWHTDVFIAKYNSSFVPQWVKWAGGNSRDEVSDIDVTSTGDIYLKGSSLISASDNLFRFENRITLQSPINFIAKIGTICTPAPYAQMHCNGDCTGDNEVIVDFTGTPPYTFSYAIGNQIQPEITGINTSTLQIPTNYNVYSIASISDANCSGSFLGEMHMAIAEITADEEGFIQSESSGLYLNSPINLTAQIQGDYSNVKWYFDKNNDGNFDVTELLPYAKNVYEYYGNTAIIEKSFAFEPGTYFMEVIPLSGSPIIRSIVFGNIIDNNKTRDLIHNGDFENITKLPYGEFYMGNAVGGILPDGKTGGFEFETDCFYETYEVSSEYCDNTFSSDGNSLFISGQGSGGSRVGKYDWKQKVTLKQNTNYRFSFELQGYYGSEEIHPEIDFGYLDNNGTRHSLLERGCFVKTINSYEFVQSTAGLPLNINNEDIEVITEFNSLGNNEVTMYITNNMANIEWECDESNSYVLDNISMLNVDEKVPAVTLDLVSGICQLGDQARIDFTFSGEKPIYMEYTVNNGTPIVVENINTDSYTIYTVVPGEYKVTKISNYLGQGFEFGIPVTVVQGTTPQPQITSNEDEILANICSELGTGVVTLSVSDAVSSDPYKLITWFKDLNSNNMLDNGEMLAISPTYKVPESGTYHVEVESLSGCKAITSKEAFNVVGSYGTYVVNNDNASGTGSLRAAIEALNSNYYVGTQQIIFCDKGTPYHIILTNTDGPLPAITKSVIIDATNLPNLVEIESNLTVNAVGLEVLTGNTTIKGFYIHGFSGTYGSTGVGIRVSSTSNNILIEENVISDCHQTCLECFNIGSIQILNNKLGTNLAGNTVMGQQANGVTIGNIAENSEILVSGNTIAGYSELGIGVYANSTEVVEINIVNNEIGVIGVVAGSYYGSKGIAGTANDQIPFNNNLLVANNTIGNNDEGIQCDGYTIKNNYIGVTASGDVISNDVGIESWGNCLIGGPNIEDKNIIANNLQKGIMVYAGDVPSNYTTIRKNEIYNNPNGINLGNNGSIESNISKQSPTITGGNANGKTVTGTSDWNNGTGTAHAGDIIELFRSDANGINAFEFIGQAVVQADGSWTATNVNLTVGQTNYVIATITDVPGLNSPNLENTSEFSTMFVGPSAVCPTITSIIPTEVCHDQNASFGFAYTGDLASETYLWDFGDGTSSTLKNPTHAYTTPGNYQVTLTVNMPGCTVASYSSNVKVNYLLEFVNLADEYFEGDNAVQLNGLVWGQNIGGYFFGNASIQGDADDGYVFFPEQLGPNTIIFRYENGTCASQISKVINVVTKPNVYLSGNGILCNGSTTTSLNVKYVGSGSWSFTYRHKDHNGVTTDFTQTGITGSDFTITDCIEGTYTMVSAEDENGNHIIVDGYVSVLSRPSPAAILKGTGTTCIETEPPVYIDFQGTAPFEFTYKIGESGDVVTETTYENRYVFSDPTEGVYYLLSVSDLYCSGTVSGQVTVSFVNSPLVEITGLASNYCVGDPIVIFTGNPAGGAYSGFGVVANGDGTANFNPSKMGRYKVRYSYRDPITGCYGRDIHSVVVSGTPNATLSGNGNICGEDVATLTIELSGALFYKFTYTDGVNPVIVELSDEQVTSDPFNYVITTSTEGNYSLVSVESGNCIGTVGSEVIPVVKHPIPTATIANSIDRTICQGETTPVTVTFTGSGEYTYRLGVNFFSITPEIFTIENPKVYNIGFNGIIRVLSIRDQYCTGTGHGTAIVHVLPLPGAELTGNGAICEGETAVLTINFTGQGPWHFKYAVDDIEIENEITVNIPEDGSLASYVIEASDPAKYELTSVRNNNCNGSVSGIINVEHYPKPTISMSGGGEIYLNDQATIHFDVTGNGPWTIWYAINGEHQNSPIVINQQGTEFAYDYLTSIPGIYTIEEFQDSYCTGDSVSDKVTVSIIGEPLPCKECISSFAPVPGERYVLNAWVKQSVLSTNGSYADAGVKILFEGANDSTGLILAKGAIIDGWQRIEQEFVIPFGTTAIHVNLTNNSSASVFFDDIRIHPFKANMKSYVYDPITMKLSAELDENNYATYYEYNEEGALIRIKKETERGVKTIQESFSNKRKTQ